MARMIPFAVKQKQGAEADVNASGLAPEGPKRFLGQVTAQTPPESNEHMSRTN
jgi:hypothetical protein